MPRHRSMVLLFDWPISWVCCALASLCFLCVLVQFAWLPSHSQYTILFLYFFFLCRCDSTNDKEKRARVNYFDTDLVISIYKALYCIYMPAFILYLMAISHKYIQSKKVVIKTLLFVLLLKIIYISKYFKCG